MNKVRKQIICMGGGGFLMEPKNPLLDLYILRQSPKKKPKVCFVGTASGDSLDNIDRFMKSFKKFNCEPSYLSLFKPPKGNLESFILEKDIIYVGGGNTRNLLLLWKEWGLDRIMKKAWERGVVLSGVSAGSICWFEEGVTDSIPGKLTPLKCLGFLEGSNCPHYDGEKERRPSYHRLLSAGKIKNGCAADDGVAIHFIGHSIAHVVSSRPLGRAYKVGREKGKVVEEPIVPTYLGKT
jgi:dipeptidase E